MHLAYTSILLARDMVYLNKYRGQMIEQIIIRDFRVEISQASLQKTIYDQNSDALKPKCMC
jgi:hypothetical protein